MPTYVFNPWNIMFIKLINLTYDQVRLTFRQSLSFFAIFFIACCTKPCFWRHLFQVFEIEDMNTKVLIRFGRESYQKPRPAEILSRSRKHKYDLYYLLVDYFIITHFVTIVHCFLT